MMTDKEPTKGIIVPVMPATDLPTNLQGEKADIVIMPEAPQRRGLLTPALSSALRDIQPVVISLTAHDMTAARKAALELIHQKDGMTGMLLEARAVLDKSLTPEMTEMLNEVRMKINQQQTQESTGNPFGKFNASTGLFEVNREMLQAMDSALTAVPNIGGDYDGDVAYGNVVRVVSRIKKGPGKGRQVKRKLYKGFKFVEWRPQSDLSVDMTQLFLTSHLKPERVAMFGPHVKQTVMRQGDEE